MTINNKFQFSVVEQRMHEHWTLNMFSLFTCYASVYDFRLELTVCSINSILIGSPRCAQLNDLCAREQHSSTVTTANVLTNESMLWHSRIIHSMCSVLAVSRCVYLCQDCLFCYSMNTKTTANTSFRHTFLFVRTHRVFSSPSLALRILMIWQ